MYAKYVVAGVATLLASVANAITLDFTVPSGGFTVQSYVDAAGSTAPDFTGSNISSEAGFASIVLDVDGENLDISIWDSADGNPYFDADSGGKPGGLGSCRVLDSAAQCVPNSDDNLTISEAETLNLEFLTDASQPQLMTFGDFVFRDDDHNLFNGSIQVAHAGGSSIISVTDGIGDLSSIGASTFLIFNSQAGATDNYYISGVDVNIVPIPAAVWLFASALGLVGWMRKRA